MEKIYNDAVKRLQEFHSVQVEPLNQAAIPHPTHWLPPPQSVYKLNFDGATFLDMASVGLGVVARDSDGMVIASLSKRITLPPTVEDLEALACRKAVSFAIEIGLWDVVFEGDSEVVIKHLTAEQPCLAAFGHIIDEARSLSTRLRKVSFSHTKRKGNTVADKLAKLARNLYEPKVWLEDIHSNVMSFVILDRGILPH